MIKYCFQSLKWLLRSFQRSIFRLLWFQNAGFVNFDELTCARSMDFQGDEDVGGAGNDGDT